ncbi:BrnT family toxin [uncultured Sphingomonas sp.]|uniref:BrnT family toxin n=1 Tax=uncultured Sphingomonas sp. TaxID=158754 RepID=UPI0035CBE81D
MTFDPVKDAINRGKHGLSFTEFAGFDADPAVSLDDRYDYGERRFRAFGRIGGIPHCLVYTETDSGVRAISFRRVHEKEMRRHE